MNFRKTMLGLGVSALLLAACGAPAAAPTAAQTAAQAPAARTLRLATTTSTQDSGLLEFLLPDFEKQTGVKIDVVAVGTGAAIKLGEDGNADVLLVHARAKEDAFMKAEHGVRREDVMPSAVDALKAIAAAGAPFISRGDKSGTHTRELAIWKAAGLEPKGAWYQSAGQGMGAVLNMAQEQQAYTISDRATYLTRAKADLKLVVLAEGDKSLFNPYGVIAVNPAKNDAIKANADLAGQFIDWIISADAQKRIGEFGVQEFGQQLFVPSAKK